MLEHIGMTFFLLWYVFALFYVGLFQRTSNPSHMGILQAGIIVYFLELSAGYTQIGLAQTAMTIIFFMVMIRKPLPGKKPAFKLFSLNGIVWILFRVALRVIFAVPIVIFHQAALQYAFGSAANLSAVMLRYLSFQLIATNWFYLYYPLPILIWYAATAIWCMPTPVWPFVWKTITRPIRIVVRR
jgi:hypothetical protein